MKKIENQNLQTAWQKAKPYLPFIISPIVSVALFVVMGFLIFEAADLTRKKTKENTRIEFLRTYRESTSTPVERFKPKKQDASTQEHQAMPSTTVSAPQNMAEAAMNAAAPPTGRTFDVSMAPGGGAGVTVGGFAVSGSAENAAAGTGMAFGGGGPSTSGGGGLTPLVRVDPEAPNNARIEGIKGSVTIRYDVNELGQTENIQVVEASPANIFEKNTVLAVQQWRFKPKMINGKAVAVRGNVKKFNFDYSGAN